MNNVRIICFTLLALVASFNGTAQPLTDTFTYQGKLEDDGAFANGLFDFEFRLFEDETQDLQIGPTLSLDDVDVVEGIFTVQLDFGAGLFNGQRRWLEIRLKQSDDTGGLTILAPRQELRAAPNALYAVESEMALTAVQIQWGGITDVPGDIADGDDDTLGSLSCADGEVAKSNAGVWGCAVDADTPSTGDTLGELECNAGEIAKYNGSQWVCDVDIDTDTDTDTTYTAGRGLALVDTEFSAAGVPMENVIVVAEAGGNFTSVAAAVNGISDASESNPYLVWVAPGRYVETETTQIPAYVHLKGAGSNVTTVTSSITAATHFDATTVVVNDNARLSNIEVENTGDSSLAIAVYVLPTSRETIVENVFASATGTGGTGHFAFYVNDADLVLRGVHAQATGATTVNTAVGIINNTGGFPRTLIEDSTLLGGNNNTESCADSSQTGIALQLVSAAPVVVDSYLCGGHRTVSASVAGMTQIHRSRLLVSSTTNAFMIDTTGSASVIIAGSYVQFLGNLHSGTSGSLICVNNYNSTWDPAGNGKTTATACN